MRTLGWLGRFGWVCVAVALAGCPSSHRANDAGFQIDAAPLDGGGEIDARLPARCSPDLSAPESGSVDRASGVAGDVATYSCDEGYVLAGNGGSSTRSCEPTGVWSGGAPSCEPVLEPCTPNPCVNDGRCTIDGDSFVCDCAGTGYGGATCTTPHACSPELAPPANGAVDRTSGIAGDVASYSCEAGYALIGSATRTCEASGRWSGAAPKCCARGQWCTMSSGTTTDLRGVWASSARDVWAVGGGGTILHWDNSSWSSIPSGTTRALYAVCGSSATDIWAVGVLGTILHWDGSGWSSVSSGTTGNLSGVWGSSASDVWAVGNAMPVHWDGITWSSVSSGGTPDIGVWGSSASDAWAVGYGGSIVHWNGSEWSRAWSGTHFGLNAVWGSSSRDVWAVGVGGTIMRWNGSRWSTVSRGMTSKLQGVGGSSASDVWAVGHRGATLHWDGSVWTSTPSTTMRTLRGIWGGSAGEAWAVGDDGTILRFVP